MDRTERFYLIDQLLQVRRATSIEVLIKELGVSESTVKRDLLYMRDRFYAPIVWDKAVNGYRYEEPEPGFPRFSLPGLWFNSSELHALLTMEHLLSNLQPGLLASHVDPLRKRLHKLMEQGDHSIEELVSRIRIMSGLTPPVDSTVFQKVAQAVFGRMQLYVHHLNRAADETVSRHISPQRLVYYNENWYVDAWCHLRDGLRTFKLSNLTDVDPTELTAIDIDAEKLDSELKAGFGIFVGKDTQQAVLKFSPHTSRWVMLERWHSNQEVEFDKDGHLILAVPYSNDPELIMRILKYGPEVEVLQPKHLRDKVAARLRAASAIYQSPNDTTID